MYKLLGFLLLTLFVAFTLPSAFAQEADDKPWGGEIVTRESEGPFYQHHHPAYLKSLKTGSDSDHEDIAAGIVQRIGTRKFRVLYYPGSAAISGDGRWVAGSGHNKIWMFPGKTGRIRKTVRYGHRRHFLALNHDGKLVASIGINTDDGEAYLHVVETEDYETVFKKTIQLRSYTRLRWSEDGSRLAVSDVNHLYVFNTENWETVAELKNHLFIDFHFKTNDSILWLDFDTQTIKNFNLKTKQHKEYVKLPLELWRKDQGKDLNMLSFAWDQKRNAVIVGGNSFLASVDVKTGKEIRRFEWKEKKLQHPSHAYLNQIEMFGTNKVVGRSVGLVQAYDLESGEKIKSIKVGLPHRPIRFVTAQMSVVPGKELMAMTMGPRHYIGVFEGEKLSPRVDDRNPGSTIEDIRIFPGTNRIWLQCDRRFYQYHLKTGAYLGQFYVHTFAKFQKLGSQSHDARYFTVMSTSNPVYLYDRVTTNRKQKRVPIKTSLGETYSTAFTPDHKMMVIAGHTGIGFYDLQERKLLGEIPMELPSRYCSISHDGKYLAVSQPGQIAVIDIPARKVTQRIRTDEYLMATDWLLGGRALVASNNRNYRVYTIPNGDLVINQEIEVKSDFMRDMAIHPSERYVILATEFAFEVLEASTGKSVFSRNVGHNMPTRMVKVTPDGNYVVTASGDTTALVHSLNPFDYQRNNIPLYDRVSPEKWWASLSADADPEQAYRAVWSMVTSPEAAMKLIKEKVKKSGADTADVQKLIAQLDADDFEAREAATAGLIKLGKSIEEPIREAAEASESFEQRARLLEILKKLELGYMSDQEDLRIVRVMSVLEWIANDEAKAFLKTLEQGSPSLQTSQARVTLQQLEAYEALAKERQLADEKKPKDKKKKKK